MDGYIFFATAAKGTEGAIRDELRELRFRNVRAERGGVRFQGSLAEGFRACLWLRTPLRILLLIAEFEAPDGEALYEGVRSIEFGHVLDENRTLAVRAFAKESALSHTQFIAQKTKDAVVDQLRERNGVRPNVDREDPDVLLFVHISHDFTSVYLDMSGASLHMRGYRREASLAPLKESLAACILRLSDWDRQRPLTDPMCGSGTFAIEAALWAHNIAPGLTHARFGFERWLSHGDHETAIMADLREAARAARLPKGPLVWAFDSDREMVEATRANAKAAGVNIRIDQRRIEAMEPLPEPGNIVVNPPYGERLAVETTLFADMRAALERMSGHHLALLSGSPEVERALPKRADKVFTVYNGALVCKLLLANLD